MALNPAQIYDPRYHTFESWACLMVELYSPQQLAIPTPTTDWQEWADGLCALDVFMNNGIPNSLGFENWDDWAAVVVNTVNQAG